MDNKDIIPLSHLDTMLERATKINEITDLRAKFEAMRVYHVNIKASRETCNEYALARVRAERKAGQVLLSIDMSGNNGGCSDTTTLKDFGISKDTSHRWQTIAKVSDKKFDELSLGRLNSGDDITSGYFYKSARIELGYTQTEYQHTPDTIAVLARRHLDADGIARLVAILSEASE
jgi:hypothetical protein